MAFERVLHAHELPLRAAATIPGRTLVKLVGTDVPMVAPVTARTDEPFGLSESEIVAPGEAVTVYEPGNVKKVVAGASLGVGKVAWGATGFVPASAATTGDFLVGLALGQAAEGEVFALYIKPSLLA